jgi:hypothetical protein
VNRVGLLDERFRDLEGVLERIAGLHLVRGRMLGRGWMDMDGRGGSC